MILPSFRLGGRCWRGGGRWWLWGGWWRWGKRSASGQKGTQEASQEVYLWGSYSTIWCAADLLSKCKSTVIELILASIWGWNSVVSRCLNQVSWSVVTWQTKTKRSVNWMFLRGSSYVRSLSHALEARPMIAPQIKNLTKKPSGSIIMLSSDHIYLTRFVTHPLCLPWKDRCMIMVTQT